MIQIRSPKVTLKSKVQLVPVILVQHLSIFFLAMAFGMSLHCMKISTCASNSDTLNFRCFSIDSMFSISHKREVTSIKEKDTARELSKNYW